MVPFLFPVLKPEEILACFSELNVPLTADELNNPEKHVESIRRIHLQLVELCLGVSRDELMQPAFAGLSVLQFPELHEDSIPHINALRQCQRLMEVRHETEPCLQPC